MRFKKKITKEEASILLYDIECLNLHYNKNKYHLDLLISNIKDLGGIK